MNGIKLKKSERIMIYDWLIFSILVQLKHLIVNKLNIIYLKYIQIQLVY